MKFKNGATNNIIISNSCKLHNCFVVVYSIERLVPDNESILSTLLEWGSDLDDVKFYLRHREEAPPFRQVVNGKIELLGTMLFVLSILDCAVMGKLSKVMPSEVIVV